MFFAGAMFHVPSLPPYFGDMFFGSLAFLAGYLLKPKKASLRQVIVSSLVGLLMFLTLAAVIPDTPPATPYYPTRGFIIWASFVVGLLIAYVRERRSTTAARQ